MFGGEFSREEIKSSSLGDHSRDRGGVFFESRMLLDNKFSVVPGAMLYRYSDYDWKFWPGLDLGYQVTEKIRNYFSVGKAFRVPTYTDLYYVSPANMGNPDLLPEESWTYEYGIRVNDRVITASLTGFIREASNLIDWSRDLNDTTVTFWQVRNISDMTFKGIETGVTIRPNKICECVPVNSVSMQYTYLDSDKSTGEYESKYALDHLKHQATANIRWTWISNISQSLKMRYLDRLSGDEYFVTDTRLTWKYEPVSLFVEITNLFDESYVEIGTVPMPGRWLRVGLKYNAAID